MVLQHQQTPMNQIRDQLSKILPRWTWPRDSLTQRQISMLLFGHIEATQKQVAEELGVQISNESYQPQDRRPKRVFAVDIETDEIVATFSSENEAKKALFMDRGVSVDYIIDRNFVFDLYSHYVVLSRVEYRVNRHLPLVLTPPFNLPRFRRFLHDLGFDFVKYNSSKDFLREKLGFPYNTSLKKMMSHFFLPWGKKIGAFGYNSPVYVKIVSPRDALPEIQDKMAARIHN